MAYPIQLCAHCCALTRVSVDQLIATKGVVSTVITSVAQLKIALTSGNTFRTRSGLAIGVIAESMVDGTSLCGTHAAQMVNHLGHLDVKHNPYP